MKMIKNKFKEAKLALVTWILSNWDSDSIFNKGKIIFIGFHKLISHWSFSKNEFN